MRLEGIYAIRRRFFRRLWLPLYRRWGLRFIQTDRDFYWQGLRLTVPAGVFHPGIFFSTPIFLKFLQNIDFQNKKTLDIGTGSGILALYAAQKGAVCTAIDINPLAVETARRNARANHLNLSVIESDLLDAVPVQTVDFVLINPPYYPRNPANAPERAFFTGAHFEYFEKLFRQLPPYLSAGARTWMVLSEDCDLKKIREIAGRYGCHAETVHLGWKWGERFEIWECRYA